MASFGLRGWSGAQRFRLGAGKLQDAVVLPVGAVGDARCRGQLPTSALSNVLQETLIVLAVARGEAVHLGQDPARAFEDVRAQPEPELEALVEDCQRHRAR